MTDWMDRSSVQWTEYSTVRTKDQLLAALEKAIERGDQAEFNRLMSAYTEQHKTGEK